MTRSPASRIAGIALLVATCAALLLALAGSAAAKTSACSAHTSRQAHACTQARHHRSKRSHASHRRKHTRRKGSPATGIVTHLAPLCEDGSKPTISGGVPTCVDGSEPQCALNTTPVFNASGAVLYCTPDTLPGEEECDTEDTQSCNGSTASTPAAPACQDGTDASLNAEGVYACDDGTEPRCGEGFSLSISEGGTTLVCEPTTTEPFNSEG